MSNWWSNRDLIDAYLDAFVLEFIQRTGRLASLKPNDALQALKNGTLGFDSIERIELSSKLSLALGLDKTGLSDLLLAYQAPEKWVDICQQSLSIEDRSMHFFSSGTTGNSKPIFRNNDHMLAEALFFQQLLGPSSGVVSTVPVHHIYGFMWGILHSWRQATTLTIRSPLFFTPMSILEQLKEGETLIATPDFLNLVMRLGLNLPKDITLILSTSPCHEGLRQWLVKQGVKAFDIFGSTETGAIAYRHIGDSHYQMLDYWELDGNKLLCFPELSLEIALQDKLSFSSKGGVTFSGREDRVVQVHGHNMDLQQLESILHSHPDVKDAQVRTYSEHGILKVKALIESEAALLESTTWQQSFCQWLTQHIERMELISSIAATDKMPKGSLGKPCDWHGDRVIQLYPSVTG
ncbi:MAG: hypothetical protein CMF25_08080 [Kangiellaceae bacterium]|nr:hypothetical protein [Kangiellaceae bacterium]|tara:strand:+ start:7928 stop:9148 length:1221 start_codon:yes stop_codon:yes gene_type:complete